MLRAMQALLKRHTAARGWIQDTTSYVAWGEAL